MAKKLKEIVRKTHVIVGSSIKAATNPEDTPSQMQAYNAPFNENELLEVFDSHYPFQQDNDYKPRNGSTNVTFQTKDKQRYGVNVRNSKEGAALATFDNHTHGTMDITNSEPRSAHKVFGTVKKVIQHHVKNNPETTHIEFSSKNEEPSRTKLYHHLAKSIDPDYEHSERSNDTDFRMKVPKLNENELPADVSLPYKMDELTTRLHNHYRKNVQHHERTVSAYTSGDSKDINHALWTKQTKGNSEYRNHFPSMIDTHIDNLHDMTTSQKTPEPLTVHSKVEYDPREKMNSKGIVHHPAFMSTSIDKNYVKRFRTTKDEHHMLSIDLPKGSPGAYIGGVSEYPEEKEFLLPKGQNLKIHRSESHFEKHPRRDHMINYHTHYATLE